MLVQDFLEHSATRLPDKVALVCGNERLTYRQINDRSTSLALYLRDLGVERQDRVAILLDSSPESVVSLFAVLKADAVFVMLSPTMKAHKLAYILNDCGIKALVTHPGKAHVVRKALSESPTVRHVLWAGKERGLNATDKGLPAGSSRARHRAHAVRHHVLDDALELSVRRTQQPAPSNIDLDLASVIYTSGSTGDPKGVMLTHLNIISAANSIVSYIGNREDDIIIDVLPLSFDYGLYQVLMAFKFGGTVVLERSFAYPAEILHKMAEEKVTGFPGVPTIFAVFLGLKNPAKFSLPSLRYITNTADTLSPDHIGRLSKLFPRVRIYSMYGLTECKRVSYLPPEDILRKPLSVGKGMPNEEVWIEDEKGVRLGPNEVGELVVRGSNVMRGYWGLPEETSRVLKPGKYPGEMVLHTGDLFRMDDEGYLYFLGRKDDTIKSKGERISPKEIEWCLKAYKGVGQALVVGVPDPVLGHAVVAYVGPANGNTLTEKEILHHCRHNLEDFMVPRTVHVVDKFPMNTNGKIDKQALLKAR